MSAAVTAEESTADSAQAAPSPQNDLTPSRLLDDLEATGREKQARLNRIRLQLQKLAAARRSTAPVGETEQPPSVPPPHELPPAPQVDTQIVEPAAPLPDAHAVPDPPDEHVPESLTTSETGHAADHAEIAPADGDHANPSSHATETLVGASIDRIALADSLFGNGQSDLALQAYSSIDLLKQPAADRYWIEYQVANCHRRLGDLPEAEQRYRRLAGLVDAGWCAAHARWWLDALSTRTALQRDLESIRTSLKTVEEQLHARPQQ